MRSSTKRRPAKQPGRRSKSVSAATSDRIAPKWKINGYPADILIWTVEEWDRMPVHPSDARYHPSGVWCALRIL